MSVTESDREFLHTAALERIQYHYEAHQEETKADRERLAALEKPYQDALSHLCPEEVKTIHDFHELSFNLNYSKPLNRAPKSEVAVDGTNQHSKVGKFSTKRAHYPHGNPDGSIDCQGARPLRYSSRGCRCPMLLSVS